MQHSASHIERLEIDLKRTKESHAKASMAAENLNSYATQVENTFNAQITQLKQLQQVKNFQLEN
jgi:Tfp pilus assembly protein PilP